MLGFVLGPLGLLYTSTLLALGSWILVLLAWPYLVGAEWRMWGLRAAAAGLGFWWAEYRPPLNGWPRLLMTLDRPGKRKALLAGLGLLAATSALSRVVTYTRTSSPVMLPTIAPGEVVRVRLRFDPARSVQRGTLVVYQLPSSGGRALSRVVGLAGDRIELRRGLLFVNGQPSDDPARIEVLRAAQCLDERLVLNNQARLGHSGAVQVPTGHVFVLADNRADLYADSRSFGPVPLEQVVGLVQPRRQSRALKAEQCRLEGSP
ncbi:signal peptidase I [Deinococcus arcticus]|uniref:signal peptidase I n=1 Tax=Deinococcus arcticus TaxID=2136176 RepID=UPI001304E4E4|nr:signal peptidase I [Deinococcus arcticus]